MNSKKLKIIGLNVKSQRVKKELTQEQLAELVDVSENTISSLERGRQNITILNFIAIARALKVDINDLIDGV